MNKRTAIAAVLLTFVGMGNAFGGNLKTRSIPLLGKNVFTEGVAYSEKRRTFYIGSAVGGGIQTVDEAGKSSWLQKDGTDARHKTLGMSVDEKRDRLWVVGNGAVYVYSLTTNKLLKKNPVADLGDFPSTFLNDVVLDHAGSAYITDSFSPNIFKVDGQSLKMTLFAKGENLPYGTVGGSPWNFNGIEITKDGKNLIIAKTNDGSLWTLNIKSKVFKKLKLSKNASLTDGLVWGSQGKLYLIRNFVNTISVVNFDEFKTGDETLRVEDLSIDQKAFSIPTNAVFLDGPSPRLVVVNSQFEQENPKEFFMTEVKLKN